MRIYASSSPAIERVQRTSGVADLIHAGEDGRIEHQGDTKTAVASQAGVLIVSGLVTEKAISKSHGRLVAHGDAPVVRASSFGRLSIIGNPDHVRSTEHGEVVVFGQPRKILSRAYGHVLVVTLEEDYQPDSLTMGAFSEVRLITPGNMPSEGTSQYLSWQLEKAFPEGRLDPNYADYSQLVQDHQESYL